MKRWSFLVWALIASQITYGAKLPTISCMDGLSGVSELNLNLGQKLGVYPNFKEMGERLRQKMLHSKAFDGSSKIHTYLAKGGNPLLLGEHNLREGLRLAYSDLIKRLKLSKEWEEKLLSSLNRAVDELNRESQSPELDIPPYEPPPREPGEGGEGRGDGEGDDFNPLNFNQAQAKKFFDDELPWAKLWKCAARTGRLLAISTVINAHAAMLARWEAIYNQPGPTVIPREWSFQAFWTSLKGLAESTKALANPSAWVDPHVIHHLAFNGGLYLTIGTVSCTTEASLGAPITGAVTFAGSSTGQYIMTGEIDWRRVITDTLVVTGPSYFKQMGVWWLQERFALYGFKEIALITASEYTGAGIYIGANWVTTKVEDQLRHVLDLPPKIRERGHDKDKKPDEVQVREQIKRALAQPVN